jgi:2-hydroxychromene-2-carboxylate isomerase
MPAHEIEFFFDIGSAYSYLASTQIAKLGERTGATIRWRPFLLGAVFKATGNDTPARIPAKAKWMLGDMAAWSKHHGIGFQMPAKFPAQTLRVQRLLTAIERTHPAQLPTVARTLFDAYWANREDITADPVLEAAVRSVGLDPGPLMAAIDAPETKDQLRAATDEAVRRGAFGAPTLFVGDQMFWGADRFLLVEEHIKSLSH